MRLAIPLSALLVLGMTACSPTRVNFDYDSKADYSRYHSYGWYAPKESDKAKAQGIEDTFTDRRIRAAVEKQLAAKGFRRVDTDAPDLLVTYYPVYSDQKVRTGVGLGVGLRILPGVSLGLGTGTSQVHHRTLGRIVLEMTDFKSNQLVWKAEADGAIEGGSSPEDAEEAVQKAVAQMLERFPPKPR